MKKKQQCISKKNKRHGKQRRKCKHNARAIKCGGVVKMNQNQTTQNNAVRRYSSAIKKMAVKKRDNIKMQRRTKLKNKKSNKRKN